MFKDKLNEAMIEKKMTTNALSERTGIPKKTLDEYRNGRNKEPTFSKGIKISDALEIDPHELLEEELRS